MIAISLGVTQATVATQLHLLRASGVDLPRRKAPAWTADEEREMLRLWDAGNAPESIAKQLGRPHPATRRRLGTARRTRGDFERTPLWDATQDDALIASFESGLTLDELAGRFAVAGHVIDARLRRLRAEGRAELAPRKPRWTDSDRKRLASRYRDGASLRQLEREFGKTRGTITSQLRTLRRLGYDLEPRSEPGHNTSRSGAATG